MKSFPEQTMVSANSDLYLPDDCWESVFKFLINDNSCLKSLSVVSKQFLSITNRLRFSLTICYPTRPFLRRLFRRFPNLTFIDLSRYYGRDPNALLRQISNFPFKKLTSINLCEHLILESLRAFSKNITSLTSIKFEYSHSYPLYSSDLFLFAECFPLLEELDLGNFEIHSEEDETNFIQGMEALSLSLSKLRKIDISGHRYINDKIILQLFKNNNFLEEATLDSCDGITNNGISSALCERPTLKSLTLYTPRESDFNDSCFIDSLVSLKCLTCLKLYTMTISDELLSSIAMEGIPLITLVLQNCIGYSYAGISCLLSKCRSIQHLGITENDFLNDQHVAELSLFLRNLVSIYLDGCWMLTYSTLYALAKNCPSINSVQISNIEMESADNSNSYSDFDVNYSLKSLCLGSSPALKNEHIIKFSSIFPNLEMLDLSECDCITEEGISQVLMRCCNLRNLNLSGCLRVKLLGMNFEAPKLEVLDLSNITVYDETLYVISKGCPELLQLILQKCVDVTNKGVKYVLENCTQLKEIDLTWCDKVDASGVASMVFSRPSLRKITFGKCTLGDKRRKHLLSHGCVIDD